MREERITTDQSALGFQVQNFASPGVLTFCQIILGSLFFGLISQLAIFLPGSPTPVSMQTCAVGLLALSLGSKKAPLAILGHLVQATMGLPVLAGGLSNPFWFMCPNAGYLVGFVVAAFAVAKLVERRGLSRCSFLRMWLIVAMGEGIIFLLGAPWLGLFVGMENMLSMGVFPFLIGGALKTTAVTCAALGPIQWMRTQQQKSD